MCFFSRLRIEFIKIKFIIEYFKYNAKDTENMFIFMMSSDVQFKRTTYSRTSKTEHSTCVEQDNSDNWHSMYGLICLSATFFAINFRENEKRKKNYSSDEVPTKMAINCFQFFLVTIFSVKFLK